MSFSGTRRDFLRSALSGIGLALTPSLSFAGVATAIGFGASSQSQIPIIIDKSRASLEAKVSEILDRIIKLKNVTFQAANAAFIELYRIGEGAHFEFSRQRANQDPRIPKVSGMEDEPEAELWAFSDYSEFVGAENKARRGLKSTDTAKISQALKLGESGATRNPVPLASTNGILILLSKILGALLSFRSSWFGDIVKYIAENLDKRFFEILLGCIKNRLWDEFKIGIKRLVVFLLIKNRAHFTEFLCRIAGRWIALSWVATMVAKIATGVGQIIAIANLVIGVINQWSQIVG